MGAPSEGLQAIKIDHAPCPTIQAQKRGLTGQTLKIDQIAEKSMAHSIAGCSVAAGACEFQALSGGTVTRHPLPDDQIAEAEFLRASCHVPSTLIPVWEALGIWAFHSMSQ